MIVPLDDYINHETFKIMNNAYLLVIAFLGLGLFGAIAGLYRSIPPWAQSLINQGVDYIDEYAESTPELWDDLVSDLANSVRERLVATETKDVGNA